MKCLTVDVCICSTCPFMFLLSFLFCLFDCHVNVDNVQRCELVKFYGS